MSAPFSEDAATPTSERFRLLLVEDDPGDALLVQELLRESAFDVVWVHTIAEAGDACRNRVDCALVDLGLPDATRLDALRRMVTACPDAAVVVLTGLSDRQLALQAVAGGAQDYLIKGEVNSDLLDRTIRLAIERRHAERAALELAEAKLRRQHNEQVARGLLPRLRVDAPDLELVTRYMPADAGDLLGGDFLDAVELLDGSVRAVVGDVAGHGPSEAAIGVNMRIAWRALTLAGASSELVMAQLQDMIVHDVGVDELFVSVTELDLSPDRSCLTARHAGHPAPILITADDVHDLDGPRASVLGLFLEEVPPPVRFPLPARWQLLAFTDGLIEGRSTVGRWGPDGLIDHLRTLRSLTPSALADEVLQEATRRNGRPLADDVALLVIGRCGA